MIQIGVVYTTFCQEEGILLQSITIEMGGVSRYFSKVLGSGVDVILLISIQWLRTPLVLERGSECP